MRRYASFFEWIDRPRAELGVVEELARTLSARGERELSQAVQHLPDPPDCTAQNERGESIAIEVTEIVCSDAARLNEQGHDVFRNWQPGELQSHVAALLSAKDGKCFHGGPFAEKMVCMFTDEPLLTFDRIASELSGVSFGPFAQIDSAYIVVSYDPSIKRYPVFTLKLQNAA
jgi:hypothetical protein